MRGLKGKGRGASGALHTEEIPVRNLRIKISGAVALIFWLQYADHVKSEKLESP
jgi:hypothetical protein